MSCLPGMPCYDDLRIAFPFMNMGDCQTPCNVSARIIYNGPNLPCTGIQSTDSLEVALQKIDQRMCSEQFVAQIINTIKNDEILKEYFCQLVTSCLPTP